MEQLLTNARWLVFDFDGTLVDSNPIKKRAFEICFSEFKGQKFKEIIAYCVGHHHTPRWEKFRHVYDHILKMPYSKQMEQALLQRFDEETIPKVIQAPPLPGAQAFLEGAQSCYHTGVLSSTPQAVLIRILEARAWRGYFERIRGAPVEKAAWLKQLMADEHLDPTELVFFGDSQEDKQAARKAGCPFVEIGQTSFGELHPQMEVNL